MLPSSLPLALPRVERLRAWELTPCAVAGRFSNPIKPPRVGSEAPLARPTGSELAVFGLACGVFSGEDCRDPGEGGDVSITPPFARRLRSFGAGPFGLRGLPDLPGCTSWKRMVSMLSTAGDSEIPIGWFMLSVTRPAPGAKVDCIRDEGSSGGTPTLIAGQAKPAMPWKERASGATPCDEQQTCRFFLSKKRCLAGEEIQRLLRAVFMHALRAYTVYPSLLSPLFRVQPVQVQVLRVVLAAGVICPPPCGGHVCASFGTRPSRFFQALGGQEGGVKEQRTMKRWRPSVPPPSRGAGSHSINRRISVLRSQST